MCYMWLGGWNYEDLSNEMYGQLSKGQLAI